MRNGGEEGVYSMERSPLDMVWRGTVLTAILGFGTWLALMGIEHGKELVRIGGDVKTVDAKVQLRSDQAIIDHAEIVRRLEKLEAWREGFSAGRQKH
jgi:hypothetical protein